MHLYLIKFGSGGLYGEDYVMADTTIQAITVLLEVYHNEIDYSSFDRNRPPSRLVFSDDTNYTITKLSDKVYREE